MSHFVKPSTLCQKRQRGPSKFKTAWTLHSFFRSKLPQTLKGSSLSVSFAIKQHHSKNTKIQKTGSMRVCECEWM